MKTVVKQLAINSNELKPVAYGEYNLIAVEADKLFRQDLTEQPSISDFASLLGVNERKLNRAFHRVFKSSPTQRMLAVRLSTANEILRVKSPQEISINAVRESVGIKHPGRFSRDYFKWFGETPSETLRQFDVSDCG